MECRQRHCRRVTQQQANALGHRFESELGIEAPISTTDDMQARICYGVRQGFFSAGGLLVTRGI